MSSTRRHQNSTGVEIAAKSAMSRLNLAADRPAVLFGEIGEELTVGR